MSLDDFFDVHVLAWTLINFIIFTLVVKFLILDPVVKVMRDRKDKIKCFEDEKQRIADAKEASDSKQREVRAEAEANADSDAEKAYENALARHRERMALIAEEKQELLKKAEAEILNDGEKINAYTDLSLDALTKAFMARITGSEDRYAD